MLPSGPCAACAREQRCPISLPPLSPSHPHTLPPAALVSSWVKPGSDSKLAAALQELEGLRLLAHGASGGQEHWAINASFQAQMRRAMCSG